MLGYRLPTMTIHRILLPIDFSQAARSIAPFVHSMAQRHKAGVTLIHVIQPAPPIFGGIGADGGMGAVSPDVFDYEPSREAIRLHLAEFAAAEMPNTDIFIVVEIGDPASVIAEYAQENAVDLICMSTHGHGAFRRALLGSVTSKVLHDAKIPVWMSAHATEATHRAHPEPRHIVVAVDVDASARETLNAAVAIAKETNATVDLVTAVVETALARGMSDAQLDELLIEGTRELLAKLQFEAGTQFETAIRVGTPADVVRAVATEKRADLVICGRGHAHGILAHLRDGNYAIIREAPCPVLSV